MTHAEVENISSSHVVSIKSPMKTFRETLKSFENSKVLVFVVGGAHKLEIQDKT